MPGIFTVAAATGNDFNKGSQYPGAVVAAEIRANGEDASQWQNLGDIGDGSELTITSGKANAQGQKPIQLKGYVVAATVNVMSVTTAARTALDKFNEVGVDLRLTCLNGETYTLLNSYGLDCAFDEERKGSDVNTVAILKITCGGTVSKANYTAMYNNPN